MDIGFYIPVWLLYGGVGFFLGFVSATALLFWIGSVLPEPNVSNVTNVQDGIIPPDDGDGKGTQ